jgi:hypothetical protein
VCKIARFREFVRLHGQFMTRARVFAAFFFAAPLTRVRIVEPFAEFFIVVPRPASAQKSQDVRS